MERRVAWGAGFLMVLVAAAVGVVAYSAGVNHGLAVAATSSSLPPGAAAPYLWHRPWGFGFLGPLGFVFLWVLLARFFFWGGLYRRGWHRGDYEGPRGFDEWHRRAHERMNQQPPAEPHGSA
jgi:hypothetical protein